MSDQAARRLAVVVKYFPPRERISGIIGYLTTLVRRLAEGHDVHVIASGDGSPIPTDGYVVHGVGFPFPAMAARRVTALRPNATVVVSGINDLAKAVPYFALFEAILRHDHPRAFYQATNVRSDPSPALMRLLRRYRSVLCAGPLIWERFRPLAGQRAVLLPPAVDIRALGAVRPVAKLNNVRIGFFNHLTALKGADVALRTLTKLRGDIDLVVAGTGELGRRLLEDYQGHSNLSFYGFLPDGERFSLIASCDIMLLPFQTEVSVLGVSQTVLECMALGVVVVGSNTASIASAIRTGEDGFLFDSEAEMRAQLNLLLTDPKLRERIGQAALTRARADFDVADRARFLSDLLLG